MSNVFTLDDLRDAAEKKFGGVKLQLDEDKIVKLRNLFQLSKEEKKAILDKLDEMDALQKRGDEYTKYHKAVAEIREEKDPTIDVEAEIAALGDEPEGLTEEDQDELMVLMRDAMKIAADKHGAQLVRELSSDDTIAITLFEEWMKSAQVGEAEHSPTS